MTDLTPQEREWTLRVLPSAEIERGISVGAYPSLMVVIDGEEIDGEVVVVPKSQNERMLREVQEERDGLRLRAVQAESRAEAAEAKIAELEEGYLNMTREAQERGRRLHQAQEALREIARLPENSPNPDVRFAQSKAQTVLAALAGEDGGKRDG